MIMSEAIASQRQVEHRMHGQWTSDATPHSLVSDKCSGGIYLTMTGVIYLRISGRQGAWLPLFHMDHRSQGFLAHHWHCIPASTVRPRASWHILGIAFQHQQSV